MLDLFERVKNNPEYNVKNSWQWFNHHVANMARNEGLGPQKLMSSLADNQYGFILPGRMYCFTYDPKFKQELPYYDNFPLVLPFAMDATHFTALNLHYLPLKLRLQLLNSLMKLKVGAKEKARLRMTWVLLSNAARFPAVGPCVKQYLKNRVRSRFVEIDMEDWPSAIFLPVQRFKKASDQQVWNDSRNNIPSRR